MNGKQVIKILKREGWTVYRVRGSHHILKKGSVKVPVRYMVKKSWEKAWSR